MLFDSGRGGLERGPAVDGDDAGRRLFFERSFARTMPERECTGCRACVGLHLGRVRQQGGDSGAGVFAALHGAVETRHRTVHVLDPFRGR